MISFLIILIILIYINSKRNSTDIHPASINPINPGPWPGNNIIKILILVFLLYFIYNSLDISILLPGSGLSVIETFGILILIFIFLYKVKFRSVMKIDTSIIHPASIGV